MADVIFDRPASFHTLPIEPSSTLLLNEPPLIKFPAPDLNRNRTANVAATRSKCPYQVLDQIGSGSYSVVYRVQSITAAPSGEYHTYAMKVINQRKSREVVPLEIDVLFRLHHPNIVHGIDIVLPSKDCGYGNIGFVLPLAIGTLEDYLERNQQCKQPTSSRLVVEKIKFLYEITNGLDFLHQQAILHLDIKPDNVMLYQEPSGQTIAKLNDFGLSIILDSSRQPQLARKLNRQFGTPLYMDPNLHRGRFIYSTNTDLWALAITYMEVLMGINPYYINLLDLDEVTLVDPLNLPPRPSHLGPVSIINGTYIKNPALDLKLNLKYEQQRVLSLGTLDDLMQYLQYLIGHSRFVDELTAEYYQVATEILISQLFQCPIRVPLLKITERSSVFQTGTVGSLLDLIPNLLRVETIREIIQRSTLLFSPLNIGLFLDHYLPPESTFPPMTRSELIYLLSSIILTITQSRPDVTSRTQQSRSRGGLIATAPAKVTARTILTSNFYRQYFSHLPQLSSSLGTCPLSPEIISTNQVIESGYLTSIDQINFNIPTTLSRQIIINELDRNLQFILSHYRNTLPEVYIRDLYLSIDLFYRMVVYLLEDYQISQDTLKLKQEPSGTQQKENVFVEIPLGSPPLSTQRTSEEKLAQTFQQTLRISDFGASPSNSLPLESNPIKEILTQEDLVKQFKILAVTCIRLSCRYYRDCELNTASGGNWQELESKLFREIQLIDNKQLAPNEIPQQVIEMEYHIYAYLKGNLYRSYLYEAANDINELLASYPLLTQIDQYLVIDVNHWYINYRQLKSQSTSSMLASGPTAKENYTVQSFYELLIQRR